MTGICATVDFSAPLEGGGGIDPVAEALSWRGPQRFAATLPHAAMAVRTWWTQAERQTLLVDHHAQIAATGDLRIDNRAQFAADCGLFAGSDALSDLELLLSAYRRTGPELLEHLLGDFAFVIVDGAARRVFAARDQMGMKGLFHAQPRPGRLVIATDAGALAAHPEVDSTPDQSMIAEFHDLPVAPDPARSFYRDVARLPPAHALSFNGARVEVTRYWRLQAPAVSPPGDDRDHAAAFREVFDRAVADRLRGPGKVGTTLSGGIDSASVTAVAAAILVAQSRGSLPAYSVIDRANARCAETAAIVKAQSALTVRACSLDIAALLADPTFEPADDPPVDPRDWEMALLRAVYRAAREDGVRIVLDGAGADTGFAYGDLALWLVRDGRLAQAWRLHHSLARQYGGAGTSAFLRTLARAFEPSAVGDMRRNLSARRRIARFRGPHAPLSAKPCPAAPRFADWQAQRMATMTADYVSEARERYERAAATFGVEARDPFCDIRVLGFLASLSANQIVDNGLQKPLLRDAMADLVPETLRLRAGKTHLGGGLLSALWTRDHCAPGDWPTLAPGSLSSERRHDIIMHRLRAHRLSSWLASDD